MGFGVSILNNGIIRQMAIQFNDITNLRGLVQLAEEELGYTSGAISGNATRLKQFTARVNNSLDTYFSIGVQASGTWQLDSKNHDDYNIIETDLIALQRDYNFSADGSGNMILDIYRVMIKDEAGTYYEIFPVDQETDDNMEAFWDGKDTTGQPIRYDKTANGIFLDVLPTWNWRKGTEGEQGVKIFINRESDYFESTDTTKTAGYPYHQEYFYLKPCLEMARINNLDSFTKLRDEVLKLEGDVTTGRVGSIAKAYGNRAKDEQSVLEAVSIDSR